MGKSSRAIRFGFWFVAVTATLALALHIHNWYRGAAFNWPVSVNMSGLILLMITGALDLPPGRLRTSLSAIAITLILVGFAGAIFPDFPH